MTARSLFLLITIGVVPPIFGQRVRPLSASRAEPFRSFRILDRKLTSLAQQRTALNQTDRKSSSVAIHRMTVIVRSIETTAQPLESVYGRRHQRFGAKMFRVLRLRAVAVRGAVDAFHAARTPAAQDLALKKLDGRLLALVTHFQAVSGGYGALRCEPRQRTCCEPKRTQDLRPGQLGACRWICLSEPRACTGMIGPRMQSE